MDVFNRPYIKQLAVVLLISVSVVSCASNDDKDPPSMVSPLTLPPDQNSVLSTAATAMGEVETATFTIERSGAPIYIDPLEVIVFIKAEGRFEAPASADALVSVQASGFNTQIGAIANEGKIWLSDPVTGKFSSSAESYAFNPITLFDPTIGWRPLLESGLTEIEWIGLDHSRTEERYRLKGRAEPDRIEVITGGLVRDEEVILELWLDTKTGVVREAEFSTTYEGATSFWKLAFNGYGKPVEISPPPTTNSG